jgi:hypothetical protein
MVKALEYTQEYWNSLTEKQRSNAYGKELKKSMNFFHLTETLPAGVVYDDALHRFRVSESNMANICEFIYR